jgi:undecaprenyl-diphosphatase
MPLSTDQQLFLFLNSFHSPFWDEVMWIISGRLTWIPLYIGILIALGIKLRRKFPVLILMIILAVALSDRTSVMIKNIAKRPRPCHEQLLEGKVHTVKKGCGGAYGFVSSHATNSFTIALLSLLLIRKRWFTVAIVFWAMVVGYSRIYLGVHYPGDVICGSLLGAAIGFGIYRLFLTIDKKLLPGIKYFSSE